MSRRDAPASVWAREELARLTGAGLLRRLESIEGPQGPVVVIKGRSFINFSSNDYLGLSTDLRPKEAMAKAAFELGSGMGSARLVVGDGPAHGALEQALSKFLRTQKALLFSSGYAANVGALQALLGPEDVVFSDALNHASLIDGCRLSRAKVVVYPHAEASVLPKLLRQQQGRRRFIVTDAVFSMDGDLAPLRELSEIAGEHGTGLYVDEAHALGVFGQRGAGLCEEVGVEDSVDVRMAGFGKSLGTAGAAVAGQSEIVDLILNKARSFVFSTALPPAVCAATQTSLALFEEPTLRESLWRNIRMLAEGLLALGHPVKARSPIFPLVLGDPQKALAASSALHRQGILVKAIRPPTVPEGTSRLRISLSARHTPDQIDALLSSLLALGLGG